MPRKPGTNLPKAFTAPSKKNILLLQTNVGNISGKRFFANVPGFFLSKKC